LTVFGDAIVTARRQAHHLVGAPDWLCWVDGGKIVIAQLLGLAEAMGCQIAHAVRNCGIVGRVGQAKQRLGLSDQKMRVQ
jgi:hypothetical protein